MCYNSSSNLFRVYLKTENSRCLGVLTVFSQAPARGRRYLDRFETFTGSVLELNRLLQKLKEIEMKPLGLRANHVMCLYHLGKAPEGLTVTELTRVCREDKAAVSRAAAQLTARGLVSSRAQGVRSYRAKLTLTPAGQEVAQQLRRRVDSAVAGGGEGLTRQQRETLYAAMNIVIDNLSRYLASREE